MRAAAVLVVAAAIAVGAAACGGASGGSAAAASVATERQATLDVGQVRLPDVARTPARPFTMRAAPGHLLLVFFGYTSCPDICPTTLANLRSALGLMTPADAARVDVAFVTVDPRRDTPPKLRAYLSSFLARFHALRTSDPAALASAEHAFGASHQIVGDATSNSYSVTHTAVLYAVGPDGRVHDYWSYGIPAGQLARRLRARLGA